MAVRFQLPFAIDGCPLSASAFGCLMAVRLRLFYGCPPSAVQQIAMAVGCHSLVRLSGVNAAKPQLTAAHEITLCLPAASFVRTSGF